MAVVVTIAKGYDLGYIWKTQDHAADRTIGGYYLNAAQAGEPPGRWWGPGAQALGLTPGQTVHRQPYDAVYRQTDPRTGAKLGRPRGRYPTFADHLARLTAAEPHATAERLIELEREAARATRQPAAYYDVTVSFSKSISVLHASLRESERRARLAGDQQAAAYWARQEQTFQEIPMDAFRASGRGKYENVLSNMYVYFWRWATWKVFDTHGAHPEGIVALITPSSFTTGAGYAGMREYLRRTADEGWIIDLSPEEFRSETGMRVFPGVQHKLCIAIFARYGPPDPDAPARIRYLAVAGSQAAKFRALTTVGIDDTRWSSCGTGWHNLLIPAAGQHWYQFPALGDLMPWSQTGVTPNRNWVQAPDSATLRQRWMRLIRADTDEKPGLLKQTRDRTMASIPLPLPGSPGTAKPLGMETSTDIQVERGNQVQLPGMSPV